LSITANKKVELWQSFMQRRIEIQNAIGTERYSVQVYDSSYFHNLIQKLSSKSGRQLKLQTLILCLMEWNPLYCQVGFMSFFITKD